jgi:hypothetical protein
MIQWDPAIHALVDNMGYPISLSEAKQLAEQAALHLKHSPQSLSQIARQRFSVGHPERVEEDEFDPKDFE